VATVVVWTFGIAAVVTAIALLIAVRREPWLTVSKAYPTLGQRREKPWRRRLFCSANFNLSEYRWSLRFGATPGGLEVSRLFWPGGVCVPWCDVSIRKSERPNMVGAELLFARCPSIQVLVSERLGTDVGLWKTTFEARSETRAAI